MNARRAARELLLILFTQLKKNSPNLDEEKISEIVIKSVRLLVNNAYDELKITSGYLVEMQDYLEDLELNDEQNLERPFGTNNLPVPLPLTSDMQGRINSLVDVAEKSFQALELAELSALAHSKEVMDFIIKVTQTYQSNREEIKTLINESAIGWDFSRLLKLDKTIMKIAATELVFIQDTPVKVVVDEAVELAKKYSSEESTSFINGILGQIIKVKNLK